MQICLFSSRPFEVPFENAQWRKVKQMQPMRLCFFSRRRFEDTFENAQWRETEQMQPMWLCLLWPKIFEQTHKGAQTSVERRSDNLSSWALPSENLPNSIANLDEITLQRLRWHCGGWYGWIWRISGTLIPTIQWIVQSLGTFLKTLQRPILN